MVQTFTALAEPNRLRIVELLMKSERSVNELVAKLGLNQPQVSKHLKVLREAGVVRATVDGPRRVYAVEPKPMRELHQWLERYRQLWDERFQAMDEVVEQLKREEQHNDRRKKAGADDEA